MQVLGEMQLNEGDRGQRLGRLEPLLPQQEREGGGVQVPNRLANNILHVLNASREAAVRDDGKPRPTQAVDMNLREARGMNLAQVRQDLVRAGKDLKGHESVQAASAAGKSSHNFRVPNKLVRALAQGAR